ncbi:MAG: nucleotidyltransferase domain-containing protein [Chlamydiae bacterium]|nr:nucleotidyltransferase domain-containing protein [Chlamydiota bacterium]
MIFLEQRHLLIVQDILRKYPYTFYAFGSRARGTHHRLSDLDLCVKEPISSMDLSHLQEDFEESDLPYKVDIVSWQGCNEEFRAEIAKSMIPIT